MNLLPLVIYHANCNDGFGAAYAAWTKFSNQAEYVPMQYGETPNIETWATRYLPKFNEREVYILDFSLPKEDFIFLCQRAKKMVWLDHHKTAFEGWCGESYLSHNGPLYTYKDDKTEIILDNNRSGALIAWEYFNPDLSVPKLIQHIDDRDRWQFKLPGTRELHAGLQQFKPSFEYWDGLVNFTLDLEELKDEGRILLRALESRVHAVAGRELKEVFLRSEASPYDNPELICTTKGLAANVVNDISETGHAIANKSGTFALTFFIKGDEVVCSLRSNPPFDVSVIAKYYGGGGHAQAAGFKMPIERFFKEIWR